MVLCCAERGMGVERHMRLLSGLLLSRSKTTTKELELMRRATRPPALVAVEPNVLASTFMVE
jgi:hypothetical protein